MSPSTATGPTWTEADLLARIDARYTPAPKRGYPQRYIIGHHVQPPRSASARHHPRIADAIVLDRNSTFPIADEPDQWGRPVSDWSAGYNAIHGFEVKVSRSDWLRELHDLSKAEAWARYCHHWWLVSPPGLVREGELPEGWGHLQTSGARLRAAVAAPLRQAEPMPSPLLVAVTWAALRHTGVAAEPLTRTR